MHRDLWTHAGNRTAGETTRGRVMAGSLRGYSRRRDAVAGVAGLIGAAGFKRAVSVCDLRHDARQGRSIPHVVGMSRERL